MKKIILKGAAFLLSASVIAGLGAAGVSAEEEKDLGVLVRVDFDGNDEQAGYRFGVSAATEITGISDGYLDVNKTNFSGSPEVRVKDWENCGAWNSLTGNAITVKDYRKITVRMRFMIPGTGALSGSGRLFAMVDGHINSNLTIFAKDGKLAYGLSGNDMRASNAKVTTEFDLYKGTWYTLELYWNGSWHLNMIPDEGEGYYGADTVVPGGFVSPDEIGRIMLWELNSFSGYVDYIEVANEGFRVKSVNIEEGEEDVPADTGVTVKFSGDVKASTLNDITVADSEGNVVPTEITAEGDSAELFFAAGLKYDEEYTVTLPKTITNEAGDKIAEKKITFKTEGPTYKTGALTTSVSGNLCVTSLDVVNNTTADKDIYILTVVYDGENKAVKMVNEKITVAVGTDDTVTSTVNIEGIESPTVKAYLWDGLNLE